jgi:hypothetical protein
VINRRELMAAGLFVAPPTSAVIKRGGQYVGKTFDRPAPFLLDDRMVMLAMETELVEDARIANEVRRRFIERLRYALACTGEERRVSLQFGLIEELRQILGLGSLVESV